MTLDDLESLGITVRMEGDRLLLNGPSPYLEDQALLTQIADAKSRIQWELEGRSVNIVNVVNKTPQILKFKNEDTEINLHEESFNSLMTQQSHNRLHFSADWNAGRLADFERLVSKGIAFGWTEDESEEICELILLHELDRTEMINCLNCREYNGMQKTCAAGITADPKTMRRCKNFSPSVQESHSRAA